jgi:hypothetical protein
MNRASSVSSTRYQWARQAALGVALLLVLGVAAGTRLRADDPAALTQEEEDRIRDAQDGSSRIAVYLDVAGARLERFNALRLTPPDPGDPAGRATAVDQVLGQYIALDDELKRWIEDQYSADHDLRRGLRTLIDVVPKQLALLTQAQQTPDRYAETYRSSLQDAIADLNDTLNGATQALAEQEKKLGQLKREEIAEAKATKQAVKDEKKRQKQEEKLRKKKDQKGVPEDEDQQN